MDFGQFITVAFSMLGGAGIVGGLILRQIDKLGKKLDSQEKARIEESITIISGLEAIGHLAEATAIAQKCGRANGETDAALSYYVKSRDALNNYLLRRSAERTHGRA